MVVNIILVLKQKDINYNIHDQLYKKIGRMNFNQGNIHALPVGRQHTDKHNIA